MDNDFVLVKTEDLYIIEQALREFADKTPIMGFDRMDILVGIVIKLQMMRLQKPVSTTQEESDKTPKEEAEENALVNFGEIQAEGKV